MAYFAAQDGQPVFLGAETIPTGSTPTLNRGDRWPGQGAGVPAQVENGSQKGENQNERTESEQSATTNSKSSVDNRPCEGAETGADAASDPGSLRSDSDTGSDEMRQLRGADSGGDVGDAVAEEGGSISTKTEPKFSTKPEPVFSTTEKPNLRLIVSTKNSAQNEAQAELIKTDDSGWKYIKGKPPYPPKHALNPSGKRQIGRRVAVGYEILRRAKCESCEKEIRLTAGYISATQLLGLERESNEIKIGIVKNILRKKAADVDERLINLRCTGCCLGSERGGISAVGA